MTSSTLVRIAGLAFLFITGVVVCPQWWCAREANAVFTGDPDVHQRFALGVEEWVNDGLSTQDFSTGSPLFDGEWLFGTYMMAAMGFGQSALEHPDWRPRHSALMATCIDAILSDEVRQFDRGRWGQDPLDAFGTDKAHIAYLGYLNLTLSLHRVIDPNSKYADLNDTITAHLIRLIDASPTGLVETYPGEFYPIDNSSFIGSLGLYDRATGSDHSAWIQAWTDQLEQRYRDPNTGLLLQSIDSSGGTVDGARGSGTAFAVYFLSYADPEFSASLYASMQDSLIFSILGWGYTREYPKGVHGYGDIDSGPVVAGAGLSASGMTLATSRIHNDYPTFRRTYATATLFGAPLDRGGKRHFAPGGPLGDAIVFALVTAPRRAP